MGRPASDVLVADPAGQVSLGGQDESQCAFGDAGVMQATALDGATPGLPHPARPAPAAAMGALATEQSLSAGMKKLLPHISPVGVQVGLVSARCCAWSLPRCAAVLLW